MTTKQIHKFDDKLRVLPLLVLFRSRQPKHTTFMYGSMHGSNFDLFNLLKEILLLYILCYLLLYCAVLYKKRFKLVY